MSDTSYVVSQGRLNAASDVIDKPCVDLVAGISPSRGIAKSGRGPPELDYPTGC